MTITELAANLKLLRFTITKTGNYSYRITYKDTIHLATLIPRMVSIDIEGSKRFYNKKPFTLEDYYQLAIQFVEEYKKDVEDER